MRKQRGGTREILPRNKKGRFTDCQQAFKEKGERKNVKEWRTVFGTEPEKPQEFDERLSPTTVYQRRNVVGKTKVEEDGTKVVGWEREERELTLDEYQQMKLVQEVVNTNKSEIVSSVTDFQKSAVIDEYTLQLVEEGLL